MTYNSIAFSIGNIVHYIAYKTFKLCNPLVHRIACKTLKLCNPLVHLSVFPRHLSSPFISECVYTNHCSLVSDLLSPLRLKYCRYKLTLDLSILSSLRPKGLKPRMNASMYCYDYLVLIITFL